MSTAIVFGANGISGLALISHLTSLPSSRWKKIIALSRREPVLDHQDDRVVFKSIDLLGERDALEKALKDAGAEEADHVFFYAYVAKEDEQELIDVNTVLFKNALQVVANVATQLQSFQLQTGYKYYGTHKGGSDLAPYPWKESSQRHPGGNFYYVEEDLLAEACKQNNWREIVTRPNHIVGASKGNFMSLATTLGLYAIASKELGQKLVYPGSSVSWNLPYDMSIASHNAKFQVFATEKGLQGAYNIHAGEPITFRDLWTRTADYFGLPAHQPAFNTQHISDPPKEIITPHSIQEWSVKNKEKFPEIARKLDLDPKVFEYATWDFIDFAAGRTWKDEGSLEKAREAGWKEDVDVWEGFKGVFDKLKELKILPK